MIDHLIAAQDFAWKKRGRNGLMQTGHADWNDSLNPGDPATESVFTSLLYCASTRALAELFRATGRKRLAATLDRRQRRIAALCNTIAWDGQWYQRMIRTDGRILGSTRSPRGSATIFLEPQPWAVIAGVADAERATAALDAADRKLGTPFGHKVMDRPFLDFDMDIGSVGIFPGGIKENGSVFNHASSWMIFAEALLGRGDRAFDFFMRMCPAARNDMARRHECEPYVACQFISQKPFHTVGRGRNAWLTGTASWMAVGAMQGILGIRPDFDGLRLTPAIPRTWPSYHVTRRFRDVTYEITVRNPARQPSGTVTLVVDGRPVDGNLIPFRPEDVGRTVQVDATIR